jgi:hypothetical protein
MAIVDHFCGHMNPRIASTSQSSVPYSDVDVEDSISDAADNNDASEQFNEALSIADYGAQLAFNTSHALPSVRRFRSPLRRQSFQVFTCPASCNEHNEPFKACSALD